jgi:signal recognition particle subunit SRP54
MFESLSDRLGGVFAALRGRGALNEADVRAAMREVRIALLEADVALPVVRSFVDSVTERLWGRMFCARLRQASRSSKLSMTR